MTMDGGIEVDLSNFPLDWRLRLDSERIMRKVGNKVAARVRRRMKTRKGMRSGQDLNNTGALIRSVKYDRREGVVRPSVRTRSDVSRRVRSNYGLYRVHLSGKYRRIGYQRLEPMDALGTEDPATWQDIEQLVEQAVAKELKSGRGGLVGELKRGAGLTTRRRRRR